MTNPLMERLKKNSTIKEAETLLTSKFFNEKDVIKTVIPALNVAFSGSFEGGFFPGLTLWCGPSKHFKSLFSLIMAKAYMDKYPDAICIFYDCEFGTPLKYFDSLDLDKSRILHVPIMNMEEFKFDVMKQLQEIKRGDHVVFVIDSIGNMSSKKEMEDAIEGKSVQDMSRAKQMKSIFRMITPYLVKYDLPMIAVNHIYMCGTEEMNVITETGSMSLKDIVPGMQVLTTNGFESVVDSFEYDEAFVSDIEMEDGTILSFTQGHRFMVNGEWVRVEDLKEGMFIDVIEIALEGKKKQIKSINFNCRRAKVYDIETPSHDYILSNGIISHNSQELFSKPIVSGGCLAKGTKIKLSNGELKEIELVRVGDLVDTLSGPKPVTHTWNPETLEVGEPECYEIEFEDGSIYVVSASHPFLVSGNWVEAEDLKVTDDVDVLK